MVDFEVVYKDWIRLVPIRSKVYAVNHRNFLIIDGDDKFIWVPMDDCTLVRDGV